MDKQNKEVEKELEQWANENRNSGLWLQVGIMYRVGVPAQIVMDYIREKEKKSQK